MKTWCSWASCKSLATAQEDGWSFCEAHLREHFALLREPVIEDLQQDLRDAQRDAEAAMHRVSAARKALTAFYREHDIENGLPPVTCGSHAAFGRHKAAGEKPCVACEEGERLYQANAHLRRKAKRGTMAG